MPTQDSPSERFAAFISYRHVEPDRRWARWLHRALESFRVPVTLADNAQAGKRLGRCFLDEEELAASASLSASIQDALERSEWLVVICSPRAAESRWVEAEVEFFRSRGRGNRILTLLIEGEPPAALPPPLRDRSGSSRPLTDTEGAVEPLCADVRGEKRGQLERMALLRLVATIIGCRFDDLRQRERERVSRRRRLLGTVGALVIAAFSVLGFSLRKASSVAAARKTLLYTDRGRLELLDGNTKAALHLLASAYELDPESETVRFLVQRAASGLVGQVASWDAHASSIRDAWLTPGGRLATDGTDGTVAVWSLTGQNFARLVQEEFDRTESGLCLSGQYAGGTWQYEAFALDDADGAARQRLELSDAQEVWLGPDGRYLATLHAEGESWSVRTWRREPLTPLTTVVEGLADIPFPHFDREGCHLVVTSGTNRYMSTEPLVPYRVQVIRLEDGAALASLERPSHAGYAELSPDHQRLLVIDGAGHSELLALPAMDRLVEWEGSEHNWPIEFAPDGSSFVAVAGEGATCRDARTGAELFPFECYPTSIESGMFSPDGRWVLGTTGDGFAVHDLRTNQELLAIPSWYDPTSEYGGSTGPAIFSPSGNELALSVGRQVRVWSLPQGDASGTMQHSSEVQALCFAEGDARLVVAADVSVDVWDWRAVPASESTLIAGAGEPVAACLEPSGIRVWIGRKDGVLQLHDPESGAMEWAVDLELGELGSIRVDEDSLLVAGEKGFKVFDLPQGDGALKEPSLARFGFPVKGAPGDPIVSATIPAFMLRGSFVGRDQDLLLVSPWLSSAVLLEHATGELLFAFKCSDGHEDTELDVQHDTLVDASGRAVLTHHCSGEVQGWSIPDDARAPDVVEKAPTLAIHLPGERITAFAASPEGGFWILGTEQGRVELAGEGRATTLARGLGPVHAVAFSPDGSHVLSAGSDGRTSVWSVGTGLQLALLDQTLAQSETPDQIFSDELYPEGVTQALFDPSGELVFTTGSDSSVCAFAVESGALLHVYRGHAAAVLSASLSSDGQKLLTSSADGTTAIWSCGPTSLTEETVRELADRIVPERLKVVVATEDAR